jgi:hypothetical protein
MPRWVEAEGTKRKHAQRSVFSLIRDEFGQWDPKNQSVQSLWNHCINGKKNMGEHFRVFPISNWTEMDVWQYVLYMENIEMPSTLLHTSKEKCSNRDGVWLAHAPFMKLRPDTEKVETKQCKMSHYWRHHLYGSYTVRRLHSLRRHCSGSSMPPRDY